MSVSFNTECLQCHLKRHLENARAYGDEATAMAFAKELMKLYLSAPEGVGSPWFGPGTNELYRRFYGIEGDRYKEEKEFSNRFMLERLPRMRELVSAAEDPVFAGLQLAILGNYLDFSALQGKVSFEQLEDMLAEAMKIDLDRAVYAQLCRNLAQGTKLLVLTDNAGEIVADRVMAEAIAERYPQLQITFCVRGGPAHNDALREDAEAVGIPFPVIDSGSDIGGTELSMLGDEAKQAMEDADVILAKGMGNTETLYGCGYNVYYAFLVKCQRFVSAFQKPLMTPMLVSEK